MKCVHKAGFSYQDSICRYWETHKMKRFSVYSRRVRLCYLAMQRIQKKNPMIYFETWTRAQNFDKIHDRQRWQ